MESSGGEVNYWPGFVDALSNVVLTLIFVLVVFVFALMMASNKVEQKYKEIIDAKAVSKEKTEVVEVEQEQIDELKKIIEEQKKAIQELKMQAKNVSEENDSEIEVKDTAGDVVSKATVDGHEEKKISLKFSSSIVNMDEESQSELLKSLQDHKVDSKAKNILVKAYLDSETYSIGQRLAYYRLLEVRNFLISKYGIAPSSISSKIIDAKGKRSGYVEILLNEE